MLTKSVSFICVTVTLFASDAFSHFHNNDGTIVKIESGFIRGHILKSEYGTDYWSFQEIPYAAPPIGQNRFQLPKLSEPWKGIRNATKNTKICYQYDTRFPDLEITEDCLYINVYTPVKPCTHQSHHLLPVLFWIHGGSLLYESGDYEYYGPKYIMDQGVVVVTINYRLGTFGFIATDDGVIPPNLGLKDQVFAMQWVNRNIHKFGGNSKQVTLVGESSGSDSIGLHLVGPWDNNVTLFHAVIMQSSSPMLDPNVRTNTTDVAVKLARSIDPNFSPRDTKDLLRFLQQAKAKDLLAIEATEISGLNVAKRGTVGAFQHFLNGNYKRVPVLIGFNSEELIFAAHPLNQSRLAEVDAIPSLLISPTVNMSPQKRSLAGTLYKNVYTNNSSFVNHPGGYVRYMSDSVFTTAVCKQVELGSANVPYYFYQFSYKGKLGGQLELQPIEGTENVGHAEELKYMWEETNTNSDLSQFPKEDQLTLKRLVKLWTNFVKYFNPTPKDDPLLNNVRWLKSDPKSLRYLNINTTLEMRENPRQYHQIKIILETYMEPPFNSFT